MTPPIRVSDLTPFYPAGTRPTTAAGRATLAETEQAVGRSQTAFDQLARSGQRDTLEQIAGRHNLTMAAATPAPGMEKTWREGSFAGVNLGKGPDNIGNIVLNPVNVEKVTGRGDFGYLPPDHPGNQLSQWLSHEYGHTVATLPAMYPDSTDVLGNPSGGNTPLPMARKMTLFEQWRQVVGKNQNLTEDNQRGLQHRGWFDSAGFNRGEGEMFADAFERAMTALRASWDPRSDSYRTARATMLENEKENPGTLYLVKWLTAQPAFKDHPLGKMLRSKEGLAGPAQLPKETTAQAMARGQANARAVPRSQP